MMTWLIVRFNMLPALLVAGGAVSVPCAAQAQVERTQALSVAPAMTVLVDMRDTAHRLLDVSETLRVSPGPLDLFYPRWIQGHHAPDNMVAMLAGLTMESGGKRLEWRRDENDLYRFRVDIPQGVDTLTVRFQTLGALDRRDGHRFSSDLIVRLGWQMAVLYPAEWSMRDIAVTPRVLFPAGWSVATALERTAERPGDVSFAPVDLDTLLDSPLNAARYHGVHVTNPGASKPVRIDVAAESEAASHIPADQVAAYGRAFDQACRLFGSQPYRHYDFLVTLTKRLSSQGVEHQQSSEDSLPADIFSDPAASYTQRNLMVHEYIHSWNGKLHRPVGLVADDANSPLRDDLLWVYEGLTTYLDKVLTVRGGLWTRDVGRDVFAETYASFDHQPGREWRSLQDTTVAPIIGDTPAWVSWARDSDYYEEGSLLWLDVDTRIRELSGEQRSLDDFIRAFFGGGDQDQQVRPYDFNAIVTGLNAVQPYDWAAMLRDRLDSHAAETPKDGLARGGYRLVYTDTPSQWVAGRQKRTDTVMLDYSLGAVIGTDGVVRDVRWRSPAFAAGLLPGDKVTGVDGHPFTPDAIIAAVAASKLGRRSIALDVIREEDRRSLSVIVEGGLRYAHLQAIAGAPQRLDAILAPR